MAALAIPAVISGISALAGLFGGRKQQSSFDRTSTGSMDQSTMPVLSPQQQQLLMSLIGAGTNQYGAADLSQSGYTAQGISNINQGYDMRRKAINSILASKGLAFSPAGAATLAGTEAGRIGDVVNFQNQVPMTEWNMKNQALAQLGNIFSSIPTGQRTTGTSTQRETGTTTGPSNMMAGMFSGLGQGLAATYGQSWGAQQAAKFGVPRAPLIGSGSDWWSDYNAGRYGRPQ